MKNNFKISLLSLLIVFSCIRKKDTDRSFQDKNIPYIEIVSNIEKPKIGEMYVAKIYLRNYDNSIYGPDFNLILNDGDTVLLEYIYEDTFGMFRATYTKPREVFYNGFVTYRNGDNYDTLMFKIDYSVTN